MKKNKKKEYSIQNFEELMALVNEDNIDMIFGNFYGVAKHFLDGFETNLTNTLPPLLTVMDHDMLWSVDDNKLLFLIAGPLTEGKYQACAIKDTDVHVMNKQSIIRNKEKLLELI